MILDFFKKKKSFPETIFHGSQECNSPREKTNLFNEYFKYVFTADDADTTSSDQSLPGTHYNFTQENIAKMLQ